MVMINGGYAFRRKEISSSQLPSLKAQEKRKTMVSVSSAVIELLSGDFQSIKITFKGLTKRKIT